MRKKLKTLAIVTTLFVPAHGEAEKIINAEPIKMTFNVRSSTIVTGRFIPKEDLITKNEEQDLGELRIKNESATPTTECLSIIGRQMCSDDSICLANESGYGPIDGKLTDAFGEQQKISGQEGKIGDVIEVEYCKDLPGNAVAQLILRGVITEPGEWTGYVKLITATK